MKLLVEVPDGLVLSTIHARLDGTSLGRWSFDPSVIAAARRAAGVSQAGLARLLGVSTGAVGMWEVGERLPDPHRLCRIADALDIHPVTFFARTPDIEGAE